MLAIILVPIGMSFLLYAYIQELIDVSKSLKGNRKAFDEYMYPSVPWYQSIYMFNLTNRLDVINNYELPQLEQLGPYVFR